MNTDNAPRHGQNGSGNVSVTFVGYLPPHFREMRTAPRLHSSSAAGAVLHKRGMLS
ncbi:hypothetical protein [Nakamurella deserti]|uniref:hypothetical protein n=1 Tax=Nakamurella deserti TaxID=2164074 RepID=UPI001300794C|nr:hypothetical protein [Nakamurella deserti]